ncbi:MAG: hypothetical protein QXW09_05920 [Thermoproteota archaeon]
MAAARCSMSHSTKAVYEFSILRLSFSKPSEKAIAIGTVKKGGTNAGL